MSFSTKIAVIIATAAIFSPVAAFADTGSTAAAVSIKFNRHTDTSGKFSITPGGNANGGGTGISELSAAVATGETSAMADSASNKYGTTANANGWSAPVTFGYEASTANTSDQSNYQYTAASKYEQQAALAFAANQSHYQHSSGNSSKDATLAIMKKSVKGSVNNQSSNQSASGSNGSISLNASLKDSATSNHTGSSSSTSTSKETATSYHYSGPATGLKFLPIVK
jgi:hypothetical protein